MNIKKISKLLEDYEKEINEVIYSISSEGNSLLMKISIVFNEEKIVFEE